MEQAWMSIYFLLIWIYFDSVEIDKEIELHDGDKVGVGISLFECHFKEVE